MNHKQENEEGGSRALNAGLKEDGQRREHIVACGRVRTGRLGVLQCPHGCVTTCRLEVRVNKISVDFPYLN